MRVGGAKREFRLRCTRVCNGGFDWYLDWGAVGRVLGSTVLDCPFFVMSSLSKVPAESALPICFVIKVHAVPAVSVIL